MPPLAPGSPRSSLPLFQSAVCRVPPSTLFPPIITCRKPSGIRTCFPLSGRKFLARGSSSDALTIHLRSTAIIIGRQGLCGQQTRARRHRKYSAQQRAARQEGSSHIGELLEGQRESLKCPIGLKGCFASSLDERFGPLFQDGRVSVVENAGVVSLVEAARKPLSFLW